ncbi:MAG: HAD-IA family hydrolase [Bacteroidota bacterium]
MHKKDYFSNFEAIIFDLGGVILNIDYSKTVKAFQDLGLENFESIYSQANQSGLFDKFEIGAISPQSFVNELLPYLPKGTSANQVVSAWNEIILDFPIENLELLKRLKNEKPTFLLSNTNEIHIQCFNRKLKEVSTENSLHNFFHQTYFSNEIALRKPNKEVFEFVCRENNLIPEKTLFIDDSIQHIEGAKAFGLNVYHLQKGEKITDLF